MNYLEFGLLHKNKKKIYEIKKGHLYDDYMLSRYFNDIFLVSKYKKNKDLAKIVKYLHDKKDLKFNLINLLLLSISKNKFYEFGFTLLEKILFFKLITKIFKFKRINLRKIKYCGNDISKKFLFFSNNFFKEYKLSLSQKINLKNLKNSVFFSKGVSILYEKNNKKLLNIAIKNSKCGSFDLSVGKKRTIRRRLETGYYLNYPSLKDFKNILKDNKSKTFIFRNIKDKKNTLYFEVVYGEKKIIERFNVKFNLLRKKHQSSNILTKSFDLKTKFHNKL